MKSFITLFFSSLFYSSLYGGSFPMRFFSGSTSKINTVKSMRAWVWYISPHLMKAVSHFVYFTFLVPTDICKVADFFLLCFYLHSHFLESCFCLSLFPSTNFLSLFFCILPLLLLFFYFIEILIKGIFRLVFIHLFYFIFFYLLLFFLFLPPCNRLISELTKSISPTS